MVNDTGLLFDVEDELLARPVRSVPTPVVGASETDLTPVAGVVLWGPLLDRLNVVAEADRRGLRPIGPGGYTGGECYRALTEILLAGGDFLADRSLLADPATEALRGSNRLPSVPTLWRFLNVPARLVRHGRRLHLRFGAAYRHLQAFINALDRLRALPAFG